MESSSSEWWNRHLWTVVILITAAALTFLVRALWVAPLIQQYGNLYVYAGGSDSYYHSRVMQYIIATHTTLHVDLLLKYPVGAINPREPLFDWMNAILGIVFAPFFGGSAVNAGAFFLNLDGPLWAAFSVVPVFLIGREVSSKRTGLIAALLFPFIVANIESSALGYANYLSFYTFFILIVIYAYIRTIKSVGSRRWVESYSHPRQMGPALRQFLRSERTAVKWAVFTGVAFGALAMAWQGYTYAVAVIAIFVVATIIIERIRRVDSFGMYFTTLIVGLVGFPMAIPYYWFQNQFAGWFDLPLLLFFGTLALMLPFLMMRDVPYVFSVPILIGILVVAFLGLSVVNPGYFSDIVTGQGYFVKNLIYSTVAEAQAPSIDQLILGYGVITFFLAFVGLALFLWTTIRGRFKRWHLLFLVFAVMDIYLPVSAAKFFLIGSPAFALLPAEAITRALDAGGYNELRRTVVSLADRRSQAGAFRKALKLRHVVIFVVVVLVVVPNVWYSIDAGIPYNSKGQYSTQIANSLPSFLQPNPSLGSSAILGAAGTSLDTPNQYDEAGYNWLATQDTNVPPPQRPAFVSWWDYGFQAVDEGQHPSVADNFQNGISPAGAFLLSQNESQAIGVLTAELLAAEQEKTGQKYLPASLNAILARDGVDLSTLHNLLVNQSYDVQLVIAHPGTYLPVDASVLSGLNAMYMAMEVYLASSGPISKVAQIYNDVQSYTGWSIRYGMTDSRLFPFSGSNTGIFYAPAELTDRVIAPGGVPSTFYNVTVLGTDGNTYPVGNVPGGVQPVSYNINYFAPFYNSMLYRIYIGYNGTDIGLGSGIPGLSGDAANSPLEPGWMLQHFQVVYKTAYYCAIPSEQNSSSCQVAMNEPAAIALANKTGGVALTSPINYFEGGESMLEYYPGQTLLGNVQLPGGTPVQGARVTVYDQWGIPHMSNVTDAQGVFSLVMPPGNDTVNITSGPVDGLSQAGSLLLKSFKVDIAPADAMSYNAPTLVMPFTLQPASVQGFFYWNTANNSTYVAASDPLLSGARVTLYGDGLNRLTTTTDLSGSFSFPNVPPGEYNLSVVYHGANFTQPVVQATPGHTSNATAGLAPAFVTGVVTSSDGTPAAGVTVVVTSPNGTIGDAVSNSTGNYSVGNFGPGNYNVTAINGTERSPSAPISVATPGQSVQQNLTVVPTSSISVAVYAAGVPATNFPVRFTLLPTFQNSSHSPIADLTSAAGNSTVVLTNAYGVATVRLPAGNYSAYAVGYIGTTLEAGFESIYPDLPAGSPSSVLEISPAAQLAGKVGPAGPNPSPTAFVNVYDGRGNVLPVSANSTGTFTAVLPLGTRYSLLALEGTIASGGTVYASLDGVNFTYGRSIALAPVVATTVRFTVGAVSSPIAGGIYPAVGARVTITIGPTGPGIGLISGPNGSVVAFLPSVLPGGGSYCLTSSASGFNPQQQCNLSPNGLKTLSRLDLPFTKVPVNLVFLGMPGGTYTVANFTATSPSATSQTLRGGPSFSFSTTPGTYDLTAYAPSNQGLFRPSSGLNLTVDVGARSVNVTVLMLHQVNSTGRLVLPSGVKNTSVVLRLRSPLANLTVNGSAYESGFFVPSGTYSVYATTTGISPAYASLSKVAFNLSGTASVPIYLTTHGAELTGNLTRPDGGVLNATVPVKFTSSSGAWTSVSSSVGAFAVVLPEDQSYVVSANATLLEPGPGAASVYRSYTVVPGSSCSLGTSTSACTVPTTATTLLTWLNGTVTVPNLSLSFSGTLTLVGPAPTKGTTVVAVTDGSFSTQILPGTYVAYPNIGPVGTPYTSLSTITTVPGRPAVVALTVQPTWTDSITIAPPPGPAPGAATLEIIDSAGTTYSITKVPYNTPFAVALPRGVYIVRADATGSPFGVPANATNQATANLLFGNLATQLSLTYTLSPKVGVSISGPSSVTVRGGTTVSFGYSIKNLGAAPVTVYLTGSPSYWGFNFSRGNVTLGVLSANNTASGEVAITVPSGELVSHPTLAFAARLASNGTTVGTASIVPTVDIVTVSGLRIGPSGLAVDAAPNASEVPFYLIDTGNAPEVVDLSVADVARLAGLGWDATITQNGGHITNPLTLQPGSNQSMTVVLNGTGLVLLPPGTVTLTVLTVAGTAAASASATLQVPGATVQVQHGTVTVTGPSLGAPPAYPDWLIPALVFVPAVVLAAGVLIFQWWRSRRWTRH